MIMVEEPENSACLTDQIKNVCLDDQNNQKVDAKHKMLKRLSLSDAFFKNQQRNDPDLTEVEKYAIANNILSKSQSIFLERYWKYLELEDISFFENSACEYEIQFYLNEIKKSKTSKYDVNKVKNRRYKAMQQLLSEGEYFSEDEMKHREPFLYEHLVGQYMTDEEITERVHVDKSDLRFSTILLKHMDILDEHSNYDDQKVTEEEQTEEVESEDDESEMEDDEEDKRKSIPDAQKAFLRQEFMSIMQEKFMSGQDKHFNYSEVDDNVEYDDLEILRNDEEEKYFDIDDDLDADQDSVENSAKSIKTNECIDNNMTNFHKDSHACNTDDDMCDKT